MEGRDQDQILNDIFKKYNLVFKKDDPKNSDVFVSSRFKIITRSGIDKIEAALNVVASFEFIKTDRFEVAVIGTFTSDKTTITTSGEASVDYVEPIVLEHSIEENGVKRTKQEVSLQVLKKGNVGQNPSYLYAIAEKRARSRGVLRLAGLYDLGFYGEDEADVFGDNIKKGGKATQKDL